MSMKHEKSAKVVVKHIESQDQKNISPTRHVNSVPFDLSSNKNMTGNSVTCPKLGEVTLEEKEQRMRDHLLRREWREVENACEEDPSLASVSVTVVCHGERMHCLPLHCACSDKDVPVSTIDALITANPSALLHKDKETKRLPIHIAILKGASYSVVRFICEAMSKQTLREKDIEGNLPLHYAVVYSTGSIIGLLLRLFPNGCQSANRNGRLPLHLICTRCWDANDKIISLETIEKLIKLYQPATQHIDRNGRVPLHILCAESAKTQPRQDLIELLIQYNSAALLLPDSSNRNPLQLMKMYSSFSLSQFSYYHNSAALLTFLHEQTSSEERRRNKSRIKLLSKRVGRIFALQARKPKMKDVDAIADKRKNNHRVL